MKKYSYLNILLSILVFCLSASAQSNVKFEWGDFDLVENQPLEIRVIFFGTDTQREVLFPELENFYKGGSIVKRKANKVGDKSVIDIVYTQQFYPLKSGRIKVPEFEVIVNGHVHKLESFEVHVNGVQEKAIADSTSAEVDLFPEEIAKEDVFLRLRTNKKQVYLKEGFGTYLALFVAKDATVSMDFYDLDRQLQEILKVLKPNGCWEENTWLEEIISHEIDLKGRRFTEYRLYQSVFFPLIDQDIRFASVELTMKLMDGKNTLKKFKSDPVTVAVKSLPPHPNRDVVAVGQYKLVEKASSVDVVTGESLNYSFSIQGSGNISAIQPPSTPLATIFDFYTPEVEQVLDKRLAEVMGEKTFNFTIVGKKSGRYPFDTYFQWVYFDPVRVKYDTLRSDIVLNVRGGSVLSGTTFLDANSIYADLDQRSTYDKYWNYRILVRNIMNVVVILMLCVILWVFYKR